MQAALQIPMHPQYRSTISGLTVTTHNTATPAVPRRRRRPPQSPQSVTWSEIKEVGRDGQTRDVIVIEDTPPPTPHSPTTSVASAALTNGSYVPPIRTRAQAAAAAVNTASSFSVGMPLLPQKKRKRETYDEAGPSSSNGTFAKRAVAQNPAALKVLQSSSAVTAPTEDVRLIINRYNDTADAAIQAGPSTPKSQTSLKAPSCDDKEGHYIVAVDDVMHNRCEMNIPAAAFVIGLT